MDYRDLKLGKHGLPTWDALIPSVLHYLEDGNAKSSKMIFKDIADSLNLPTDLRKATYPNNPRANMIEDRIKWTISELNTGGALERPSRGVYKISSVGKELLTLGDAELTGNKVHSLPAYVNHKKELKERNKIVGVIEKETTENNDDDDFPENMDIIDNLTTQTDKYNNEIATNLLKRIQDAEPAFFENLVVKLLVKMGYKGPNGSSKVTQKTNDGGIDGIINQDPLGTNTVYIQAKRYKDDNVVQRPAIDGFFGALSRVHADRGVFITTSHFSSSAISTAKNFSIVLIDGIQLTNLMLQYQVGVQVKKHLDLFEIDEDFFEE
jgi:restriction system protein